MSRQEFYRRGKQPRLTAERMEALEAVVYNYKHVTNII